MSSSLSDLSQPVSSDADARKPYLTIRPGSGWASLNIRQLWMFRDLLFTFAERDIKLRYKQTALGVLWVIFQPILGAGLLSFVFNRVAQVPSGTINPFVFNYVGMLAFNLFSNTLTRSSGSLVGNASLISKIFFPRLVLPLSTSVSSLVDFFVALAILPLFMLLFHVPASLAVLTLPLWVALILMLSLGVGLTTSALSVSYRDVQYMLPVLISFLPLASPISYTTAYLMSRLPLSWHPYYYVANPFASLLEAFRWSLTGNSEVPWPAVGYASCFAVAVFVLGAFAFKKMERRFADVI